MGKKVTHRKPRAKHKKTSIIIIAGLAIIIAICYMRYSQGTEKTGIQTDGVLLIENEDQIENLELNDSENSMVQSFRNKISYRIEDIVWDGEHGTAEVMVCTPELPVIIQQGVSDAVEASETDDYQLMLEEAEKNIQKTLDSDKCSMKEVQVTMEAKKDGDEIILVNNDEFESIIMGNLGEMFIEMLTENL